MAESATGACGTPQRGLHLRRRLTGTGPASTSADSAARCAGAMPAAGINGFAFPFSGLGESPEQRGARGFGSVKPL